MENKEKLNYIASCVDSSKCDLMQIDIYRKEIEQDLQVLENIKVRNYNNLKEKLEKDD